MDFVYYMEPGLGGGGTIDSASTVQSATVQQKGFGMDPLSAGMQVGGQFLSQYLAQRAAEEENKKKLLAEATLAQGKAGQTGAEMTRQAFRDLMRDWQFALTGR